MNVKNLETQLETFSAASTKHTAGPPAPLPLGCCRGISLLAQMSGGLNLGYLTETFAALCRATGPQKMTVYGCEKGDD